MLTVDKPAAEAIRWACHESGELAGVVELRRHFLLLANNENARICVRAIAAWMPLGDQTGEPITNRGQRVW